MVDMYGKEIKVGNKVMFFPTNGSKFYTAYGYVLEITDKKVLISTSYYNVKKRKHVKKKLTMHKASKDRLVLLEVGRDGNW